MDIRRRVIEIVNNSVDRPTSAAMRIWLVLMLAKLVKWALGVTK